jgi:hypothetical protein
MAHPLFQKNRAMKLRKKGFSINEISKKLDLSKSTVNVWCRDVVLNESQLALLQKRKTWNNNVVIEKLANQKRKYRLDKVAVLKNIGAQVMSGLTDRDLLMIGFGLYWGEGYKNSSSELGFTNSDPAMIKFYIQWLRQQYKINLSDLILRVSINQAHTKRVTEVEQYWSHITKIPLGQFTKTSLIKAHSKKRFSNHFEHYGTLRVKVRRGTDLWRQIMGSIEFLKKII